MLTIVFHKVLRWTLPVGCVATAFVLAVILRGLDVIVDDDSFTYVVMGGIAVALLGLLAIQWLRPTCPDCGSPVGSRSLRIARATHYQCTACRFTAR
ncbi:MAG: hypothetical protein P8Q36_02850 [Alphaproteobacteria bacterium]|nr:hypothetical protein [Rhodospirillaceae bacterium]MBT6204431.1 hypothetical protein [Rhodospirillaceae bacterium]MBT6511474.1 hypothetical protein [Rhodospirillaceae bacterium]MBT7645562.1 hypothetical protein [Rhodospirillaceae bacterium]MDG2479794.1 hypothetical protein [Alphaproteobacteria bacterium]